ncbi:aspartyl-phosphate phosphatase Spo0E family protein (plasmid) [Paenibacillus sonchi]|uniref:Aspartyl-phosphate phosphatase Spo0E family protein n=1 Tax=Paenibacillus sonchi TaxID=373687 RepID=A0A974PJE8_9BACL|nr:aspartyl-phosphate phosphatase Spo0E family protein [Paenibacillus sonchi]QQZ64578.1 aspartyl-phosphate phosphatase Spo0E family protein [Paenibacillus sonchi]
MDQMNLQQAIEHKRAELNALPYILESGFTDEHIKLSTELDVLLNQFYQSTQKRVAK